MNDHLAPLIGDWTAEVTAPGATEPLTAGRVSFEWFRNQAWVVFHSEVADPMFPSAISVIGPDEMHYFDSRGVKRVYTSSLEDGVWTLERRDPDFWQRFVGEVGEDEIVGRWEKSDQSPDYELDFHLTYRRIKD